MIVVDMIISIAGLNTSSLAERLGRLHGITKIAPELSLRFRKGDSEFYYE
jgi:hypothetical protein